MTKWEKLALIYLLQANQGNYESHVLTQLGHLDDESHRARKRTQTIVDGLRKELDDDQN